MALNSCEAAKRSKRNSTEESLDRFSDLPDELAHRILSLLSFKDLTCVGCASKRFRNLRLSVPSIRFNHCFPREDDVEKMLDSFNSFMVQRGDDSKMQIFQFGLSIRRRLRTECFEKMRLSAWINSAVRCNVEKLSVGLNESPPDDPLFPLPSAVFLCDSLRSLAVHMNCVIGEVSSFPSMSNLKSLNLSRVSVIDESYWEWISCSCKRLETLTLENIHGSKNIRIRNSSLKTVYVTQMSSGVCSNLIIMGDRLEKIYIASRETEIYISAPNVKRFIWRGKFLCRRNLGEMRCLNVGDIFCFGEEPNFANLVDLLCGLSRVKTLELNYNMLKAMSKDGLTFASFNRLSILKVNCTLTDDVVPGLISILQRTPSLRSLQLNSHPKGFLGLSNVSDCALQPCGFDIEFWRLQNLAIIDHLKKIAVPLYHGSNPFEFARYIAKYARNLEKMDILYLPNQFDDVMKLRDEMISNGTVIHHQQYTAENCAVYEPFWRDDSVAIRGWHACMSAPSILTILT